VDDLDEDDAERPRFPQAVMDPRCGPGPEPTTLEAVDDQWHYALVVVQAGDDDDYTCSESISVPRAGLGIKVLTKFICLAGYCKR